MYSLWQHKEFVFDREQLVVFDVLLRYSHRCILKNICFIGIKVHPSQQVWLYHAPILITVVVIVIVVVIVVIVVTKYVIVITIVVITIVVVVVVCIIIEVIEYIFCA